MTPFRALAALPAKVTVMVKPRPMMAGAAARDNCWPAFKSKRVAGLRFSRLELLPDVLVAGAPRQPPRGSTLARAAQASHVAASARTRCGCAEARFFRSV